MIYRIEIATATDSPYYKGYDFFSIFASRHWEHPVNMHGGPIKNMSVVFDEDRSKPLWIRVYQKNEVGHQWELNYRNQLPHKTGVDVVSAIVGGTLELVNTVPVIWDMPAKIG